MTSIEPLNRHTLCLYCDSEPASCEHSLPAALGEFVNAPLLENRLCGDCNNKRIGKLDEQFARCGIEALLRTQLGIKGRSHHEEVNPFYRGSSGGGRIQASAWDDNFQCKVNIEFTGTNQARQITEIIFIDKDGRDHHIPLTPKTTVEELRAGFARLELEEPFIARITFDTAKEGWARDIVLDAWPSVTFSEPTVGSSLFEGSLIEFRLTDRYFRAVAKIGFHYFLSQFTLFSGREPAFDDIRNFIITDINEDPTTAINQFVKRRTHPVLFPPYRKDGWLGNALVAEIRDGQCMAHFEPFIHRNIRVEARTIMLGRVPDVGNHVAAHLNLYYPEGKRGKFSGQAFPVTRQVLYIECGRLDDVIPPQR
jgi:hypothetical protein